MLKKELLAMLIRRKTMYWLLLAIPIGIVVSFIAIVLIKMVFIAEISDMKVYFSEEMTNLNAGVSVKELAHGGEAAPYNPFEPQDSGAMPSTKRVLLTPDGKLLEVKRYLSEDPNIEVESLTTHSTIPQIIFKDNDIYAVDDDRLGAKIGEFSNPAFRYIGYAGALNEKYFLVHAVAVTEQYNRSKMWQVRYDNFEKTLIEQDPYYAFVRVPKVFKPNGFDGTLLAVYSGSVDYGYGGDSSRPKYSVLRAYTSKHPDGIELLRLGLKAGTLVDVEWSGGDLILICDPSRPSNANKKSLPLRRWQVHLPDNVI
jgi:hypothetical protein